MVIVHDLLAEVYRDDHLLNLLLLDVTVIQQLSMSVNDDAFPSSSLASSGSVAGFHQ